MKTLRQPVLRARAVLSVLEFTHSCIHPTWDAQMPISRNELQWDEKLHYWCATMKLFQSPGYGNSTPDVLALKIFTPKIAPLNKQWKGNDKDQWERIIHCELHSLLLQIGDQVQEAEKKNREFSLTSWLSRKRSTSSCWTCSSGNRCQWLDFRSQAQFRDSHKVGPKSKRDQNVISGTWICNLSERKWYLLSRLFRSSLVAQQIIWKTRF